MARLRRPRSRNPAGEEAERRPPTPGPRPPSIRLRILLPTMVAICGLLAGVGVALYSARIGEIEAGAARAFSRVQSAMREELDHQGDVMLAAAAAVAANEQVSSALMERDRDALGLRAGAIFEELRTVHQVSLMQFSDPVWSQYSAAVEVFPWSALAGVALVAVSPCP